MSVTYAGHFEPQTRNTTKGIDSGALDQVDKAIKNLVRCEAQDLLEELLTLDATDPDWGDEDSSPTGLDVRLSAVELILEAGVEAYKFGKRLEMPSYSPTTDGRIVLQWNSPTYALQVFLKDSDPEAKVITTSGGGQKTEYLRFSLVRQKILATQPAV